ncbi:MAG: hypothetical protein R3E08_06280 [Thiotrichaceae bacterium]
MLHLAKTLNELQYLTGNRLELLKEIGQDITAFALTNAIGFVFDLLKIMLKGVQIVDYHD